MAPDPIPCPNCRLPMPPGTKACTACGEPLPSPPSTPLAYSSPTASPDAPQPSSSSQVSRIGWISLIVLAAVFNLLYRLLVFKKLEQTAALFIGLPLLIALAIVLAPSPRSVTGLIMKVITLALCFSGLLLGEGVVCILFLAPLAYLVGLIIGTIVDVGRRRRANAKDSRNSPPVLLAIILPFLGIAALEGTSPTLSFPRHESVTATLAVPLTPTTVRNRISRPPSITTPLPLWIRSGFPQPVASSGHGLAIGDRRTVRFAGGEGKPGDLTMEVIESSPNSVTFRAVSDSSHIAHWLAWNSTTISWHELRPGLTEVSCTIRYERLLDPAWYFAPAQRTGVSAAATHLLRMLTAP